MKTSHRIPVMICIDVEPDGFFVERGVLAPWRGYECAKRFIDDMRPVLSSITGFPAHVSWFLRMDPQILEVYGSSEWVTRRYPEIAEQPQAHGDGLGLHVHAYRWDDNCAAWIIDHANQNWVEHCIETAFTAYEQAFGQRCDLYRGGDRWLSNETVALLEKLGVRFDLTTEPGQPSIPSFHMSERFTGSLPDYTAVPTRPYRPSASDYRLPDDSRDSGIWMIPLTTVKLQPEWRSPWKQRLVSLVDSGQRFEHLYRTITCTLWMDTKRFQRALAKRLADPDFFYLAFAVRTDCFQDPARFKNIRENLEWLLTCPVGNKLLFVRPDEFIESMRLYRAECPCMT